MTAKTAATDTRRVMISANVIGKALRKCMRQAADDGLINYG